jgi:uncharacterized protein YhbP (UPF0306 family)
MVLLPSETAKTAVLEVVLALKVVTVLEDHLRKHLSLEQPHTEMTGAVLVEMKVLALVAAAQVKPGILMALLAEEQVDMVAMAYCFLLLLPMVYLDTLAVVAVAVQAVAQQHLARVVQVVAGMERSTTVLRL